MESQKELQNDLNKVFMWCSKNKLTINIAKTKAQYLKKTLKCEHKQFLSQ